MKHPFQKLKKETDDDNLLKITNWSRVCYIKTYFELICDKQFMPLYCANWQKSAFIKIKRNFKTFDITHQMRCFNSFLVLKTMTSMYEIMNFESHYKIDGEIFDTLSYSE